METGSGHTGRETISRPRVASALAASGLILALVAAFSAVAAAVGSWWHWWSFGTGFLILRWATYVGIAAGLVCLAGSVFSSFAGTRASLFAAMAGLALVVFVVGTMVSWWTVARRVPMIHDITTDTENPPSFVAILALRKNAPNPTEYGGPKIATLQHRSYPDIRPALLPVPPSEAFKRALAAAKDMGWQIVDANEAQGRIEATATTTWFHFKDDVVIRVAALDGGSRVDVRSVSRVGRSDLGTNARRIRAYIKALGKDRQ